MKTILLLPCLLCGCKTMDNFNAWCDGPLDTMRIGDLLGIIFWACFWLWVFSPYCKTTIKK